MKCKNNNTHLWILDEGAGSKVERGKQRQKQRGEQRLIRQSSHSEGKNAVVKDVVAVACIEQGVGLDDLKYTFKL